MATEEIRDWIHKRLFDKVPVCICVIDRDYRIVEANRSFTEKYGASKGRPCFAVYKGREEKCEECGARRTFVDGKARVREERGRTQHGRQEHYLVHLMPIVLPGGHIHHVIEMSTDISQVKRLEQEKRDAERLAAVGETVAGIAHGIKNVLMGLDGGMYVFSSGLERGDEKRISRGWKMLQGNIKRITKFVREFLDFARGHVPVVVRGDPNRPARKVAELFGEKADQCGIRFESDLGKRMPQLYLDEEGIHTCLSNLVSNAIYACAVGDRKRDHKVKLSSRLRKKSLLYEIADNGCGMDYEISRKIFSIFFSTKGSGEGTGLGLLTTKKIVHQHGGKISFESEEGRGSVFRIEIPLDALARMGREQERSKNARAKLEGTEDGEIA